MNREKNSLKIGDMVIYNGFPFEEFYDYEQEFIDDNLEIGESYKILLTMNISTSYIEYRNILWYRIIVNDVNNYWIPSVCFNINNKSYMKNKYNLK